MSLPSHRTTEHGTKELPITERVNVGEPAFTVVCDNEMMLGPGRFAAGVVVVNVTVFDVPDAFDTETRAIPGKAVSVAKIEAVSRAELPKVVARGNPFQFTTEPFAKFEPFTVNVNPLGWQYGVDESEVEGAETDVITGAGPAAAPILKLTMFETSVVVVAVVLEDPETAEPGIWTATRTVPALVKFEAGTIAVSWVLLTNVVVSWIWFGPEFQRTIAPGTNPAPFAVIVKPVEGTAPAATEAGLRNVRTEVDVWFVKFVLNWEQPPTRPNTASAAIIHLREYIRTRSSPSHPCETPGRRKSCEYNPGAEEISDDRVIGCGLDLEPARIKKNPRQTGLFLIPPELAQVNYTRNSVVTQFGSGENEQLPALQVPPPRTVL